MGTKLASALFPLTDTEYFVTLQPSRMIDYHLQLAILRLEDLCVGVQEGMDRFLATAALEKRPGVEATFHWLRKRSVRICLLSDYGQAETQLLLDRLGWTVDESGTVQYVVTRQGEQDNPVVLALEHAGIPDPNLSFTVCDTPELLLHSNRARVHFNLAVCNGRCNYSMLATCPHHAMLDSLLQVPNFILAHLPEPLTRAEARPDGLLPKLRLPRPLARR